MELFSNLNTMYRAKRGMNAARMAALSFGAIILIGAVLLTLPVMSKDGQSAGFLTGLFTATSATCVTGLAVCDTLTQWTTAGHVVILLMIQMGGLSFMAVTALILTLFRRNIAFSQRMVLATSFGLDGIGGVVRLVRHALAGTLLIEGVGAVLLSTHFIPMFGLVRGIWYSVFHSVSAFCNAGFDLMGTETGGSLIGFSNTPFLLVVHGSLVVLGGLGFVVWEDIYQNRCWKKLTIYSRLVLIMTASLLVLGTLYFFLAEYHNPATLGGMSLRDKVFNALFQATTLRTAGFTSLSQGELYESSLMVSALLMLIGGSGGSTAGGVKTVTFLVLLASLRAGLRGRDEVCLYKRTLQHRQVSSAMTLTLLIVGMVFLSSVALSLWEDIPYLFLLYETVSAVGTVGLSTGITASLSVPSELVLIFLMYMGRVGVLSFSLAFIARKGKVSKIHYPTCNLMIG